MSALTTYAENRLINFLFGAVASPMTAPANWYVGLFTSVPTDAGSGTELTGAATNYARQAIPNTASYFSTTVVGEQSLIQAISFPEAGNSWGTIQGIVLFDAVTGGNAWFRATLTTSQQINQGDVARIPIGAVGLYITLE